MSFRTALASFWSGRAADRARGIVVPLLLVLATIGFGVVLQPHYPFKEWLFFRYAAYWLAAGVWTLGCLSSGHRALRLLGPPKEDLREQIVLSFGLGVLLFFVGVFLAGILGLLKAPLFYALPLLLIAAGGRTSLRFARRCIRLARSAGRPRLPSSIGARLFTLTAVVVAVVAIALVYASILSPENASFDARWYHLGMAEHYTSAGAVERFPEGWFIGAYPQLASLHYTWAFLFPTGKLFDKVELSAHLEFVIFLWTLAGVSILTRRLVPRARPRFAFVAMLLFPGLYLYDSSLTGGADHVAALWSPLVFLTFLRAYRDFSPRSFILAAAAMSGALLTKYTAASMVVFPILGLGIGALVRLVRAIRARPRDFSFWRGPAAGGAAGLVLTAPHWLKNWIWYGNPVYPLIADRFHNRPWSAPMATVYTLRAASGWAPRGTLGKKLTETLGAVATFSFAPHDWPRFHGSVPVFGSLFTLTLVVLPFLKGTKRIWALMTATHLAVFFWYWTQHEDRYLQAVVPWMAASAAAILTLAWRLNVAARLTAGALLLLQLVWGASVYFIPAHAMLGKPPIESAIELMSSGYKHQYDQRLAVFTEGTTIGTGLPKGSRVLLHEYNPRLGIGVPVVTDAIGFQGGIDYGRLGTPKHVFETLRGMGVTHVAWKERSSRISDSLAGDLLFFDFVAHHAVDAKNRAGWSVARLADAPAESGPTDVLYLGCQTSFSWGLYSLEAMAFPAVGSHDKSEYPKPAVAMTAAPEAEALVPRARYIVNEPKCFGSIPASAQAGFTEAARRGDVVLWMRKAGK